MAQDKVSIRISKEDMEKFNTLASSLSMTKTAVIKKIVNDGFAQTAEITNPTLLDNFEKIQAMLESIEKQLKPLGDNVNQIARKINSNEKFTDQDRKILASDLKILEQASSRFETLSDLISTRTKKTVIKKRGSK
ncbi:hypothetical protein JTY93_26525 [Pseudomonas hygromyciniae]|uniref:Plasmid mobilization relaxosome protein MobC n=1 Tax=Pseudomonas hygromyciniae TaxID=2812000 RepID=A0ABX7JZ98_9PSED|nr:hypothetical protein [Pseudomonas hygromyciniae]MBN0980426.1 hypothetical protein [Pseudomonas hygromyciniae]QSB39657.1 hypothetical protein JTY93_26525 [Pseudomonas hygromyciniae]